MENCRLSCVVCLGQFNSSDQISHVKFKDQDSRKRKKISLIYRKILRIFCTYFNLPCKQKDNENVDESEISSSFPFCAECRNLVAELCIFHDQIESTQKRIGKTIAKITIKIINTEKQKNFENYSNSNSNFNSDSLETQNGKQEPENGRRNKIECSYRQTILQNFNPRVHLTDCQSTNKVPSQRTNQINSSTTDFENVQVLKDEDSHDNRIHDDAVDVDVDVDIKVKIEENRIENDDSNAEIPQTLSSQSILEEDKNHNLNLNLNLNLKSVSANEQTGKSILQRLLTKSKLITSSNSPLQNPCGAKTPLDSSKLTDLTSTNSNSNSDNRNQNQESSLADKMRSDTIENLGDGKFVYKKLWPFHIIDDSEFFQCDTCKSKIGFPKNPKRRIYTTITEHIAKLHTSWSNNVKQNEGDGKFQFSNKSTFEKVDGGFKCGQCQKIYPKLVSLISHIQIWHMPGEFQCPKCPLSCRTQKYLDKHRCGRNLQKPEAQNQSIKVVSGKIIYNGKKQNWEFERLENGKFQCLSCPAIGKYRGNMTNHIKNYHDDVTEHVCDECGKNFNLKSTLSKHKLYHLKNARQAQIEAQAQNSETYTSQSSSSSVSTHCIGEKRS